MGGICHLIGRASELGGWSSNLGDPVGGGKENGSDPACESAGRGEGMDPSTWMNGEHICGGLFRV